MSAQSQPSGAPKSAATDAQPSAYVTRSGDPAETPWTVSISNAALPVRYQPADVLDANGKVVIRAGEHAEHHAFAHLIAAAPDGLAAAKALTAKYVARDFPQYMRGDWLALEAFVAKATGEA